MRPFEDQTAVITGATGAVGGAIAARLNAGGSAVVLVGRNLDALKQVVAELHLDSASVQCCVADLSIEAEVAAVARSVRTLSRKVHVLVHAAGVLAHGVVERSDLQDFDRQYSINLRAPYQLTQALLPELIAGRGQVVFVNSSAGIKAPPGVASYAATKHGLRAIADGLRDEVNDRGVRVLSVYLGRTASRMQAAVHAHEGRVYRPERLLQPADVAMMIEAALLLPRTAEVTDLHIRSMQKV